MSTDRKRVVVAALATAGIGAWAVGREVRHRQRERQRLSRDRQAVSVSREGGWTRIEFEDG